jgi:metallo-beta-lactamase class B
MKNKPLIISILLTPLLSFAYPVPQPFPPFKIADNLYYVGTADLASYLVVTPKGNILINSSINDTVPMLKESIAKLGFKYSDTKILLISHAHADHAEGSKLIKDETHVQYMVMAEDVPDIESGGKTDFQYRSDPSMYFPVTKVDKVLHDGDKVSLGGVTLTAHLTPGHTKGCTTWSMRVNDHGKSYNAVIIGSLNVNPGYKLVANKSYPKIAQDYIHAIKTLEALPCDIFLGAHAGYFDLQNKYAKLMQHDSSNPFVDPQGCRAYIAEKKHEFDAEYAKQS